MWQPIIYPILNSITLMHNYSFLTSVKAVRGVCEIVSLPPVNLGPSRRGHSGMASSLSSKVVYLIYFITKMQLLYWTSISLNSCPDPITVLVDKQHFKTIFKQTKILLPMSRAKTHQCAHMRMKTNLNVPQSIVAFAMGSWQHEVSRLSILLNYL